MAFVALNATEVDAKSPLDDALFEKIKDNFDDLNSRVVTAGNWPFTFEVNGPLNVIRNFKRSICYGLINKEFTPTVCRMLLKKSGASGSLTIDIRKHTRPNSLITSIIPQYQSSTTAIAQQGSAINTQSIARAATQVNIQSISFVKAALSVSSIVAVQGTNQWRYNFTAAPDADFLIGKYITFASCTAGGNNGTFLITGVNESGGFNVVVTNATGVAQTGAAGTGQLQYMSYNFTNPVDSHFAVGDSALFASCTSAANDGDIGINAVNSGGNNVLVYNQAGVAQAGVAGTMDCLRWKYSYSSAASSTDYVVGEYGKFASHSSAGNNGNFVIRAVNSGGNNIIVYNTAGVVQGGAAGTALPNRWKYSVTDPTGNVEVGDTMYLVGHTNALNDGSFTVKEFTTSTIVVYNTSGVAQASVPGSVVSTKKVVSFASDLSATYTTSSYIEILGAVDGYYNASNTLAPWRVIQVNRGGGSNYNVVIDVASVAPAAAQQNSPAGFVAVEMKSIFTSLPSIAASLVGLVPNENLTQVSTDISADVIATQTPLMLYITAMHTGNPKDLTVILS